MSTSAGKNRPLGPRDVPAADARKVVRFLNRARTPEEIADALGTAGGRSAALRAAVRLLNRRALLGKFKNLNEVAETQGLSRANLARLISAFIDRDYDLADTLAQGRPSIGVDGTPDSSLTSQLIELSVEETKTSGPRCEARFVNWGSTNGNPGYLWLDRQVLDFGKTLIIDVGGSAMRLQAFEGCITGLRPCYPQGRPPELVVLAQNRYEAGMRMTRRTRTFEEMTDRDVFQHVASEHGMGIDIGAGGAHHKTLAQAGLSDWEFLLERARAIGLQMRVDGYTLRVFQPGQSTGRVTALTYGRQLKEFTVTADLTTQRTSVKLSAWDPGSKDTLEHEATESAIAGELSGDISGSRLLEVAFGEQAEHIALTGLESSGELQALADAAYREMAHRFVIGQGVADGYRRLRVGDVVSIQGVGPLFSGRYHVSRVRHSFTQEHGFRTFLDVERPGLSPT
jgi:phage protein D